MTKNTLDSIIKSYVNSIAVFQQQDKINPLDLRLPGSINTSIATGLIKGSSLPTDLEESKYISEHTVVTSNGIIPGAFDTKAFGMSPADPIRESLGFFWVLDPVIGPTYARNQLAKKLEEMGGEGNANYFSENKTDPASLSKIISSFYFNSEIKPGVLYKTIPAYFKNGVEHFEFTEPSVYTPNKPFDFKSPVLNVGFNQYLKVHYNYSKAAINLNKNSTATDYWNSDDVKNTVPLTVFSGLEIKNEGIKANIVSDGYKSGYSETTVFFDQSESETNWDGVFPYIQKYNLGETPEEEDNSIQQISNNILSKAFGVYAPDNYEDHSFYCKASLSDEVVEMFSDELNQNDAIADIVPVYNFTAPFWEKATNNFQLFPEAADSGQASVNNELAIGNIYAYAFNKNDAEKLKYEFDKYGSKLLYCGLDADQDESLRYSNLFFATPIGDFTKKVDDIKYQFPMYTEITFKQEPLGELGIMLQESGMLLEFYETLLSYIYTANKPLGSLSEGELNSIFASWEELEEQGILNSGVYSSFEPNLTNNRSIASKIKKPAVLTDTPESYILQNGPVGDYNFLTWLETYIQYLDNPQDNWKPFRPTNTIQRHTKFFGLNNQELVDALKDFSPKKVFGLLKFMPKFQKFVTEKTRGLHDIFSADKKASKMAYSETIMYQITKRDNLENTTLQSIFIPPSLLQDTIKYIDTQVRYGREYSYTIEAIKMVIGTEYKYKATVQQQADLDTFSSIAENTSIPGDKNDKYGNFNLDTDYIGSFQAPNGGLGGHPTFNRINKTTSNTTEQIGLSVIEVKYRPTVRVITVPYYQESRVAIVDNPPMPPLTNIYPLSGQKNKLLMTFENQTGDRDLIPVPIQDGDSLIFDTLRFYQRRFTRTKDGSLYNPTLRFKSDDVALGYQVFKIAGKKPTGYQNFSNALVTTVSMENLQAGYEDTIATNIKYYYTFRTIDRHGNISNPSPVYEVEMVEDSDVTYPIIKILDKFDSPKDHTNSKPFRRYLMIDAADDQIILNEDQTGIVDDQTAVTGTDPVLGIAEKSLWNDKLFKFRIKSKQTGKMIDLNMRFKTRHIVDGNENTNLCD